MHSSIRRLTIILGALVALAGCTADGLPTSDRGARTSPISEASSDRYIVQMSNPGLARAALNAAGANIALELPAHDAVAAHIPSAALAGLQHNPHITLIEEDPIRRPTAQSVPYGIDLVQASDAAFDVQRAAGAGNTRTVCIIDSGLHVGHDDIGSAATGDTGSAATTPWDQDDCGHGTHVAGTIAASDNSLGVVGVLPDVNLHIVRVFSGTDCGWTYGSDLVAAVDSCMAAGASVINMSLGGSFKSRTEERAFVRAYEAGLLPIAAAGNDGNNRRSYPAAYDSVVAVAAVDSDSQHASFSQTFSQVELAAPGVAVESSVPWTVSLDVGGTGYDALQVEYSAAGTATGTLVAHGLCDTAGSPGEFVGRIVLCERGAVSFNDKVQNAAAGNAEGVIIYNNEPGPLAATLGEGNSSSFPAVGVSQADGALIAGALGASTTITVEAPGTGSGYEAWDGTSMATPHVTGVAALVWNMNSCATNQQIRDALTSTAQDLGVSGRDSQYGFGLVQAAAANAALSGLCGPSAEVCDDGTDNDLDGDTDCADSECAADPACIAEICDNGADDDGDGDTDCADSECDGVPACTPEVCDDGSDNDGDGETDCADTDCATSHHSCITETCDNGVDDDGDGDTDCDDSECAGDPSCPAGPVCGNGTCEAGEDCYGCGDCEGRLNGRPTLRFCCGDGTPQSAEGDGNICDGNY